LSDASGVDSNRLGDYFNDSDVPLEEPTYEYHTCDFCLTPPCSDCLPWDFNIFKLSEIPLFFPDAIVNGEGVIEVHKHKNCRCGLFPVSGFILDDDLMSDNVRDKMQAIRNHKLAFREEDNNSLLNEILAIGRQQDAEAVAVAQMKANDPFVSAMKENNPFKTAATNENDQVRGLSKLWKESEPAKVLSKSRQTEFNFTTDGELKLAPKVAPEIGSQLAPTRAFSLRSIRGLQAFRSPQALARVGMREGIGAMGEAGLLGSAEALGSALPPMAFLMVLPELEKALKVWFDNYMKTQQVKTEAQFNKNRAEAYLNVYRGIIPA